MTKANLHGGCFCGAIRYEIQGRLRDARACHCSRCRKAFSGASSAYAEIAPDGRLKWLQGRDQLSVFETGGGWGMAFCSTCGSTLCGMHNDAVHGVSLGCIDGDPGVEIRRHIFVDSRAPWDHIGGEAPQFAEHAPDQGIEAKASARIEDKQS